MTEPIGYLIEKSGINNGHYFIPAADYVHVEERFQHLYQPVYAHPAAQPEYLSGCQLRGPGECERIGMCQSQSCKNAGKVIVKRVCVEPKEAGIVYPKVET